LLPTVVNPSYSSAELPVPKIEEVVADQFASFGVRMGARPRSITAAELAAVGQRAQFPYTPSQLARAGSDKRLGLDAAVGISVIAWSRGNEALGEKASIDLLITFVDLNPSVKKYWVLSGSWSARTLHGIPESLEVSLGGSLIDVKWYARSHLNPWGSTQVFSPDEPLVTISSSIADLEGNLTVPLRSVSLTATGIYDSGLSSLRVTNDAVKFDWVFSHTDNSSKGAPIFLSTPVLVPLGKGSNRIVVTATSAGGQAGQRVLKVVSTAERKLHVVPIAVAKYEEFATPHGDYGMAAVRAAAEQNNSVDLTSTSGLKPTKYELAELLQSVSQATGSEDPAIILFSGRVIRGRVPAMDGTPRDTLFLLMRDSSRGFPGIGAVSLQDVTNVIQSRWTVVLAVCSDDDLSFIRQQLQNSMPVGSVAEVTGCENRHQSLLLDTTAGWLRRYTDPRYPQANLDLLETIRRRVTDAIVVPPAGFTNGGSGAAEKR
jgi:hypothetical protein